MAYLYDTFTEAGNTALTSHIPDVDTLGAGWQGSASSTQVYGGTGYLSSTATGAATSGYYPKGGGNLPTNDWQVDCPISLGINSSTNWSQIRLTATNNGFSGYIADIIQGTAILYKIDGSGTATQLGSTYTIPGWTTGTYYTLSLVCNGTTISLLINGSSVISVTDSTWATRSFLFISYRNSTAANTQLSALTLTQLSVISAQAESVSSSDVGNAFQNASPTQTESVTSADSQSATASGAANAAQAESLTLTDAAFGALVGATNIVDFLSAAESLGVSVIDNVSVAETLVLSTTINAILTGLPVTSPRFWRIFKWDPVTEKKVPASGLTPVFYLIRPSDMLWLDLLDGIFKSFAGCSLPKDTMVEVANIAGLYIYMLASEQFSLSDQYYEFGECYGADNYFAEAVVLYVDGVEQIAGINGTMPVDGAVTLMQKTRMDMAILPMGDATIPSGTGNFEFRGQDGRVRIAGTVDADGLRTITSTDGTK